MLKTNLLAKITILILLTILISENICAQNLIDQYAFSKVKKAYNKKKYKKMSETNSKLSEKYPYNPIVIWYEYQWNKYKKNALEVQFLLLEKVKMFYSTLSDKNKNIVDMHVSLEDINNEIALLDKQTLLSIEKNCDKQLLKFFLASRKDSFHLSKVKKLQIKCAYLEAFEDPTVESLNHVINQFEDPYYTNKAVNMIYDIEYEELKKKYNLKTALNFYYQNKDNLHIKDIEHDIYQWYTIDGHPDSFIKYALLFKNSPFRKRALNLGISLRQFERGKETRDYKFEQDSLKYINKIKNNYIDFYKEDKQWEYLFDDGSLFMLPNTINDIESSYFCHHNLPYLIVQKKNNKQLFDLIGRKVDIPNFNDIKVNKYFLILKINGKYNVYILGVHKPLIEKATEIEIIDDLWIKYNKNKTEGIIAINGYSFNQFKFDEIEVLDDVLIVSKGKKKNILKIDQLSEIAQNNISNIILPFDDVYKLYENRYVINIEGKKGLINSDGESLIKAEYLNIEKKDNLLLLKTPKELLVKDAYTFNFILETQEIISSGPDFFHRKQDYWLTPLSPELAADSVKNVANNIWEVDVNGKKLLFFSIVNKYIKLPHENIIVKNLRNDKKIDIVDNGKTVRINYRADTLMTFNGFVRYEFQNAYYLSKNEDNYNTGYFTDKQGKEIWDEKVDAVEQINEKFAIGKIDDNYYIFELNTKQKSLPFEYKPKYIGKTYFYHAKKNIIGIVNTIDIKNMQFLVGNKIIRTNLNNDRPYVWISNKSALSCYYLDDFKVPVLEDIMYVETVNNHYDIYTNQEGKKGILSNQFIKQPLWDNIKFIKNNTVIKATEIQEKDIKVTYLNEKGEILLNKSEQKNTMALLCK